LNFGGDLDRRLDTGIVFRIRYCCDVGKAGLRCNYDVITLLSHDSVTATALHAACSVTGARYRETGKRGLGGGMHCPSAWSFVYATRYIYSCRVQFPTRYLANDTVR